MGPYHSTDLSPASRAAQAAAIVGMAAVLDRPRPAADPRPTQVAPSRKPSPRPLPTPDVARAMGTAAYRDGLTLADVPFGDDLPGHVEQWADGWKDAAGSDLDLFRQADDELSLG